MEVKKPGGAPSGPPRVLMVSMWYPPAAGGLPRQAHLLTRTLVSLGTPVRVVTTFEGGIRGLERRDGVAVHRLPALQGGGNRRRAYPWLALLGAFLVARRREYDIIHVHEALHAAALSVGIGHLLGKKCVVKVAGSGETGNLAVLKSWNWSGPISLRLLRRADTLISQSPEMSEELRASGFDPAAIVELPNGVELSRFQNAAPLPAMARSVIVSARLSGEKALDVLLRAWPAVVTRVPGWRIVFLGNGPERGMLERLAHEVGVDDSVRFLGEVADVAGYLAASKVFVLPSRYGEGMSNAVLEALVAGCACLASDIAANAQLIEHGVTGLLFRSEDVTDLARRLGDLLENQALRQRLGEAAARVAAERYSIGAVARRYQDLYGRLLAGRPLWSGDRDARQT